MLDLYDLNLRHLLALPVIARTGGVTAACAEVHLSQPALTQGLAKVEAALGVRLFDRQPQGVSPTLVGQLLIDRVSRAAAHFAEGGRAFPGPAGPALEHRLTMSQIRALIAVAEHGSFALAARETGLAQPSVHRAARELEASAGQPLFLRSGKSIRLSAPAVRFARHVRLAMAELRAGLHEVEASQVAGAGRVTIGALPLARSILLPQAIARFRRGFPAGQVQVIDGPYAELLSNLRAGDIDLVVGAQRDPPPAPDVLQEPLFDDRLIIAGRRGHPLAEQASPTLAEMARFPWVIARAGTPLRAQWEAMFRGGGVVPPAVRAECNATMAVRGLLLEDDWLTLLSPDQVEVERRAGLVVQIGPSTGVSRRIALTVRRDWRPTEAQAAMAALLRELSLQRIE